jgi:hypothetical protein
MAAISAKSAHWLQLLPYQYSQTWHKSKQESGVGGIFSANITRKKGRHKHPTCA